MDFPMDLLDKRSVLDLGRVPVSRLALDAMRAVRLSTS